MAITDKSPINVKKLQSALNSLNAIVSFNATRPFISTSYTGTDPTPELFDSLGGAEEGNIASGGAALLAPGIDRRADYFASKSVSIGLKLNF